MSYECRNPTRDTYNPRLADIWSLGIILLNLLYHRSPWNDPNPEECKPFAAFRHDKIGFLMEKFSTMQKNVAQFFASYVFCDVEKGRISIEEWRNWCDKLVERMLYDEIELDDVFDDVFQELSSSISKESSSFAHRQNGHDRHQSWSDIVGEFESETEFNNLISSKYSRSSSKRSSQNANPIVTETNIDVKVEKHDDEIEFTEKDNENHAENANNSDADSGFGTDEDINGNIIKRLKERGGATNGNSNSVKALSVSPPKVIYCKPKPWGDYRSRAHKRENSIEGGSTISNVANNNHWTSYNQRRERLEQRRKEKQEQTLNSLGAYRRRGSLNTDANDSFTPSRPFVDRRRPQRTPNTGQESIYTAPPRRNVQTPRPLLRKKSSQSINNDLPFIPSPPKATADASHLPSTSNSIKTTVNSSTSKQRTPRSYDKTPKKVGKSTKNHLGKMLAGVVMFNRGIKVGGQVINENID
ncbi:hypothetical protein C1645_831872 [Glomus cerebriforme]|uniref:Protein kinase domain-containing protein n=1 Tax=Glomus cerebriforme TaxID=658196 RepID=A0A397SER0_9GLOM|nr:hypothetical protein C1645_831872 [Glomus cerebriforme]